MSARQSAALIALQASLATAFEADPDLRTRVQGRVHDGTPKAPVAPYLAFADARTTDWSGGETNGVRATIVLEAIAVDGERGRAVAILDRAGELALGPLPALAHGLLVLIRVTSTSVERLKDGRTWRARASIEALIDG